MGGTKRVSHSSSNRAISVIDCDGHFYAGHDMWEEYLEKAFLPYRPQIVRDHLGVPRVMIEGVLYPRNVGAAPGVPWGIGGLKREGGAVVKARLADMDLEGIDQALCFPTFGEFYGVHNPRLAAALARAHNAWARDYCDASGGRVKAVPILPLQDDGLAVEELRRCINERESWVGGILLPSNFQGQNLDERRFQPFFEIAEETGLPVMVHAVAHINANFQLAGGERTSTFFAMHSILHPFEQMLAIMAVLSSGLLDRLKTVSVAFLEAGVGWIPSWIDRLDDHYKIMRDDVPHMTKPASEYLDDRVFFGVEASDCGLGWAVERLGAGRFLYASDYPHFDAEILTGLETFRNRSDLNEDVKRAILGDNARRVFPWAKG